MCNLCSLFIQKKKNMGKNRRISRIRTNLGFPSPFPHPTVYSRLYYDHDITVYTVQYFIDTLLKYSNCSPDINYYR